MLILSTCGHAPCCRAKFANNRIFVAPTLPRLLHAITKCIHCSHSVVFIPNQHKMDSTIITLVASTTLLSIEDVPATLMRGLQHPHSSASLC